MIPFGGGCVMVWGGISLTATTGFYVVNRRSLNSGKHITEFWNLMCPICPSFW
jgi:hypothetical protein